jgi:hypothetical protein
MWNIPILFLDYDGVLHSGLPCRNPELFEHLPILEEILAPMPAVRIVLSTTWARQGRYAEAKRRLDRLEARVIGAIDRPNVPPGEDFRYVPRGVEVVEEAAQRGIQHWIAVDDDVLGWPEAHLERLVACGPRGLASAETQSELRDKLEAIVKAVSTAV